MILVLKRLFKLAAGYSFVTLMGPLFTLLLTPLYTRYLEPSDYAVVDITLTFSGFASVFVLMGMDQAISTLFFSKDISQTGLVSSALLYIAGMGGMVGGSVALLAPKLSIWLFNDPARDTVIYLVAINLIAVSVYALCATVLRLRMGIKRVNAIALAYILSLVTSNIIFVLVFRFKATGVVTANVIANTFAALIGLWLTKNYWHGVFSVQLMLKLIKICISLLPGLLGYLTLANIDRIMLTQYVSPTELGLYSIANKLASIASILIGTVWNAWWPMSLEMADKPDSPRLFARLFEYFMLGSILSALVLGMFAHEILQILTSPTFWPAAPYAMLLMIYTGPIGMATSFFYTGLVVHQQTRWMSVAIVVAAIANVLLNLLLSPYLGVWGAVWATIIGGIVQTVLLFFFSRRAMFVDYRWLRMITLVALYLLIIISNLTFILPSFALRISLISIFCFAAMLLGIINRGQVRQAKQYAINIITKGARKHV